MDTRGFDDHATDRVDDAPADDGRVRDAMFDLGGDERRMHVRAYNHWVSLLKGRPYPCIADLDPASIADFGPHSVLLDFSRGLEDPGIAYLGRTLREECGLDAAIRRIADVPSRSLLSRLTDHYLQIIANRAPIGFEAEFVGTRGRTTLYRGILTPYSSDGDRIDFIYGVINWKEIADATTQAALHAELDAAVRAAPAAIVDAPVWADGPSAGFDEAEFDQAGFDQAAPDEENEDGDSLADRLARARDSAAAVLNADTRSRAALYAALGRAHDFALAAGSDDEGLAELLAETGIKPQARAPMTAIAKLVFGAGYDKTRLTEYAAVLDHAKRSEIARGGLVAFLDAFEGGIKGVVAAERLVRKPPPSKPEPATIADRAPIARVAIETGGTVGDVVVLVARVREDGALDVVGAITGDRGLSERAIRALA